MGVIKRHNKISYPGNGRSMNILGIEYEIWMYILTYGNRYYFVVFTLGTF